MRDITEGIEKDYHCRYWKGLSLKVMNTPTPVPDTWKNREENNSFSQMRGNKWQNYLNDSHEVMSYTSTLYCTLDSFSLRLSSHKDDAS